MTVNEESGGSLLKRLSEEDAQVLRECARRVEVHKDDEVLKEGQRNGSLFFVQEGLLHVMRRTRGRALLLGRLEAGSFFGEISIFDPGPTTATVKAVTDAELFEMQRPDLERFIKRRSAGGCVLLTLILEQVATRLRDTDQKLIDSLVWGGVLKGRAAS